MEDLKMRLLFICKKRSVYGLNVNITSFGLTNSAMLVCKALTEIGVDCKTVIVNDANDIDREVTNYNPTHVILEALWVTPDKMREIVQLHQKKKWVIRIHSKIPFLAYESIAIDWIHEFAKHSFLKRFVDIASNSERTCRELSHLLKIDVLYLPNLYPINWNSDPKKQEKRDYINIGCFGSIRPLKNTLIQAIAAIKFADSIGKTLYFHVNGKTEQNADGILKNLRNLFKHQEKHTLVEHDWYEHDEFIKVIKTMDLGMQVSYSETFNIVIADFVDNNIPVVVSREIDWLPGYTAADPNSVESIFRTLKSIWKSKMFGIALVNKIYLNTYNKKSLKFWLKYLGLMKVWFGGKDRDDDRRGR
jgi:hypothetical protein